MTEQLKLFKAIQDNDISTVKSLLETGAEVNATDCYGNTPLRLAVILGRREFIVELLLNHGADANAKDDYEDPPLHRAAMWLSLNIAGLLIAKGAALHCAVRLGHPDIIELLSKHGAEVNAKDIIGETPIAIRLRNLS